MRGYVRWRTYARNSNYLSIDHSGDRRRRTGRRVDSTDSDARDVQRASDQARVQGPIYVRRVSDDVRA
jgi:hypothetical protein